MIVSLLMMLFVLILGIAAAVPLAVEEYTDWREMRRAERTRILDDGFFTRWVGQHRAYRAKFAPLY
jgi:hypothetical protein